MTDWSGIFDHFGVKFQIRIEPVSRVAHVERIGARGATCMRGIDLQDERLLHSGGTR